MEKILIFFIFLSAISGCAYITTPEEKEELKGDIQGLSRRHGALEKEFIALKEEVEKLKTELAGFRAMVAADTETMREEFSGEFSALRNTVEEARENMKLLEEKGALLGIFEDRLRAVEEKSRSFEEKHIAALGGSIEDIKKALSSIEERVKGLEERAAKKEEEKPADPRALYEEGLEILRTKKDYAKALEVFSLFLSLHPKHELTDNAQYWIGEVHYATGDFERAIVEFNKVPRQWPESEKIPAALLKQGFSFEKIGAPKEAVVVYERLLEKYPKAEEAESARARLKEIKKK